MAASALTALALFVAITLSLYRPKGLPPYGQHRAGEPTAPLPPE